MKRGAYEVFFNLNIKPFEIVPNPDFLYLSNTHKKAMTYLDYGINEKAGFILLTGEVGSGKTTLIRDLVKKLNGKVTLSKVFNTKVNSEQLISMVNDDFGLDIKGKDKVLLLKELYDFLIEQYSKGNHSVLIIDEAQNLSPDLLEEVRMLSNLETDNSKLMQIILVGQPELKRILSLPELRQLRQRINISCHISQLTRTEIEEYIFHRLEIAGNRDAVSFADGSLDIIYQYTKGIPRLVNKVCDFLMLSAFTEETKDISVSMVKDIVSDIELKFESYGNEHEDKNIKVSDNTERKNYDMEIKNLLSNIKLLTDTIKNAPLNSNGSDIEDINKRLDLLEKSLEKHRGEVSYLLSELRNMMKLYESEQIAKNSNNGKPKKNIETGVVKRIFGLK